ncbi:MAG: hypothetical protein V7749_00040 [Cocleimonas sp.]|jgi:hypothetical protein
MNCPLSVCGDIDNIKVEEIVKKIELAAIEFTFNLEILEFSEVLLLQGISDDEYDRYFYELTEFLSYSNYKFADASIFNRAKNAHKLMSNSSPDNHIQRKICQLKIIDNCFEWLMPFPILTVPSE